MDGIVETCDLCSMPLPVERVEVEIPAIGQRPIWGQWCLDCSRAIHLEYVDVCRKQGVTP